MLTKINLGCGADYREGYINVDDFSAMVGNNLKRDVEWNLKDFPWPFPDNYADEILMVQVLEHLPDKQRTFEEIKRILKVGGKLVGAVPYARSYAAMVHWQHYNFFYAQTFYMLGEHFNFSVMAKNTRVVAGWKWRIRNLLFPGRLMEICCLNEAYDNVEFELTKLSQ